MGKLIRTIIALFAILGLLSVGVLVSDVVNAQPPVTLPVITISSNGSIQSSLSPLPITQNGNVYIITGNISGYSLDIKPSNVILQGNGYTLQANALYNTNSGVTIEGTGVTAKNFTLTQYYVGIDIKGSNNTITDNLISVYDDGVNVEGQSNSITDNVISNCGGFGIELLGSINYVNANTINCNDGACMSVNGDSNSIAENLLISGTFDIEMYGNSNNIVGNTITGGSHGIIFYDPANANLVQKNDIVNNYEGIGLDEQVNTFYLNNLINNTYNVRLHVFNDPYTPYSMNVFDNGSVGNYWADYSAKYPNAKEIGNTGIYNTPYVIDGNITDNYPLVTPYTIGSTGAQISTSSVNPTASSTVPELSWFVILPLLLSVFSVAVVLRHRKTTSIRQ